MDEFDLEPVEAQEEQDQVSDADRLQVLMSIPNLADMLEGSELGSIATDVCTEYQIDKDSRKDWEERVEKAMELAMLVAEQKNYPFEKASNVKYPLLTTAALQFNARAYPAIVQGNRVVRCMTWGEDQSGAKSARADRVSEYMSWQLLAQLPEWEEDTDKMMVILPITGCAFRKVYYDPSLGRNCTRLVTADRLVVNYHARSLEEAPRVTEELYLYPYEIEERIRDKRYIEFEYGPAASDGEEKQERAASDPSAPHLFLEQHRLLDLDEDGYPEPYIVTVHKATEQVVRVVANFTPDTITMAQDGRIASIRKQQYYVKYIFLPSPDGGFYGWGFGWLLKDIGEAINTSLNQMLDAGHLSNVQGGLVSSSLGVKDKQIRLAPGEWRVVQTATGQSIQNAILPINYPGPSATLFQLLGMLIESGKDIASIKDVLTGETKQNMPATTALAFIEQGLQVFTSIYKRIHRALKSELGLHAKLNVEHVSPEQYAQFFDAQEPADPAQDFSEKDMDILPVSDPNMVSRMQQLAKAQFLQEWARENPLANQAEVAMRVLQAAQVDDVEKLIQPPDPKQQMLMQMAALLELQDKEADIVKKQAGAMKDVAAAASTGEKDYIGRAKLMLDAIKAEIAGEQQQAQMEAEQNGQDGLRGVEGSPGNAMGAQAPVPQVGGNALAASGAPVQLDSGATGGMALATGTGGV